MRKLVAFVSVVMTVGASNASALFTNGLQVVLRADDMLRINNGHGIKQWDVVSSWQAEGLSPVSLVQDGTIGLPHWRTNGFVRADGSIRPSVSFRQNEDGTLASANQRLKSGATKLNLTTAESTWFAAYDCREAQVNTYLFGLCSASPRWGGFYVGSSDTVPANTIRMHAGRNTGSSGNLSLTLGSPVLLDCRGDSQRTVAHYQGVREINLSGANEAQTADSAFSVGCMLAANPTAISGNIAEIIVYNRALLDAECVIVREALTARWGLVNTEKRYSGAASGYCDELVGVGCSTASDAGLKPGVVAESGSSSGLRITVDTDELKGCDGYVFAARDGADVGVFFDGNVRRLCRSWRIESTLGKDTPDVNLTFIRSEVMPGYRSWSATLVRKNDVGVFEAIETVPMTGDDEITFCLSGDVVAAGGVYTLRLEAAIPLESQRVLDVDAPFQSENLTGWYRADRSVTREGAVVEKWGNGGTCASAADVVRYSNEVSFVDVALTDTAGVSYPALSFPGDAFLSSSPTEIDFGLASGSGSYFIVHRPEVGVGIERKNMTLFGLASGSRFGVLWPNEGEGKYTRCYFGKTNFAEGWPELLGLVPSGEGWQLLDATSVLDGKGVPVISQASNGACVEPPVEMESMGVSAAGFEVGHCISTVGWSKPYVGDIAEIRIYDRPLLGAERKVVELQLLARYGLGLDRSFGRLARTRSSSYVNALAFAGAAEVVGRGTSVIESEDSGGLSVAVDRSERESSGMVCVAHDGRELEWVASAVPNCSVQLMRSWCVAQCERRDLRALRLLFRPPESSAEKFALLYRKSESDEWFKPQVDVRKRDGEVIVNVPAGVLMGGYYTLAAYEAGVDQESVSGAGVSAGLKGWWRADQLTEDDGSGRQILRNAGFMGPELDATLASGDAVSIDHNAFMFGDGRGVAGLTLDGTQYFKTSPTLFDIADRLTPEVTYFAVAKFTSRPTSRSIFGCRSETSDEDSAKSRFGIFITGSPERVRLHQYVSAKGDIVQTDEGACPEEGSAHVFAGVRTVDGCVTGYWNGDKVGEKNINVANTPAHTAEILIGRMLEEESVKPMQGALGEVRVYNRALTEVERNIVTANLKARYGVPSSSHEIYHGMKSGYGLDVSGVGAAGGDCIESGEDSSGLSLSLDGSLQEDSYVLIGHGVLSNRWKGAGSGLKIMARSWYLSRENAEALPVSLKFDLEKAGVRAIDPGRNPVYGLYRLDGETWVRVNAAVSIGPGIFEFDSAALEEGVYTLGAAVDPVGTMLIVR